MDINDLQNGKRYQYPVAQSNKVYFKWFNYGHKDFRLTVTANTGSITVYANSHRFDLQKQYFQLHSSVEQQLQVQ